jgi:sulfite exporter TauE/SafE
MATVIAAVLVASLVGSLHCAGMCGPLVAFAVGGTEAKSAASRAVLQLGYHGGRLLSYSLLGAVCGLLGAAADLGGSLVGLHRLAAFLAGSMMVAVGVVAILRYRGTGVPGLPAPAWLKRLITLGQRAAVALAPLPRAVTVGLLSALLPCGWLYAFAVVAAGTGSALWGAAIMMAFWMGSVPILASLGAGVQALTGTLGRRVPLFTALAIVLLGLLTIADRLAIPLEAFEPPLETATDTLEQVEAARETKPPCCRDSIDSK